MIHKINSISAFCLTLMLLLCGCQKKEETIKIGLAGVKTGPDGQIGTAMIQGAMLAIDEWNEKGGVLGKKIEVINRDDEGKPNQAVAVAQELASNNVCAVIGHFNSGCTLPASEIYNQNKILQITPGSTNPQVTERGFPLLFRMVGRDDQIGSAAAKHASQKLGAKVFAVLHNKTPYGVGVAEEFKKSFEAQGGKIVLFDGVGSEELDFRANISAIKASGAEGLFWGGMYNQGGPLVVQMRQEGLNIPFMGGDGIMDNQLINTIGTHTENLFIAFWPDYKSLPGTQPFLQKYRAKYGEEGPYSVYGYDAANVLIQGIQEAGTTDSTTVAAKLREKPHETSLGTIEFDSKGDLKTVNFVIWGVKDGKFIVLPE